MDKFALHTSCYVYTPLDGSDFVGGSVHSCEWRRLVNEFVVTIVVVVVVVSFYDFYLRSSDVNSTKRFAVTTSDQMRSDAGYWPASLQ